MLWFHIEITAILLAQTIRQHITNINKNICYTMKPSEPDRMLPHNDEMKKMFQQIICNTLYYVRAVGTSLLMPLNVIV